MHTTPTATEISPLLPWNDRHGFAAFSVLYIRTFNTQRAQALWERTADLMKKKTAALLPVLLGFGIMFTACGNNNTAQDNNGRTSQNSGSAAQSGGSEMNGGNGSGMLPNSGDGSVIGDNSGAGTGDIDGDGIIEDIVTGAGDIVTGAEDIVGDVIDGADDMIRDIAPGERDNATETTTETR